MKVNVKDSSVEGGGGCGVERNHISSVLSLEYGSDEIKLV